MNPWQKKRKSGGWTGNGLVEWTEGNTAFLSVVFTWKLYAAWRRAKRLAGQGYAVRVGGPAVALMPEYLSDVAQVGGDLPDVVARHNPNATFTTRGCLRRCAFCAVPRVEGDFRELEDWVPRPIVCDNNLLASSREHFNRVIDCLKEMQARDGGDQGQTGFGHQAPPGGTGQVDSSLVVRRSSAVDFNQGLDIRLLKPDHVERLRELDLLCLRFSWDHIKEERAFLRAFDLVTKSGFAARRVRVYVLIGYDDTPADALYRLRSVWGLGAWPFPMRYEPLNAHAKRRYVGPGWSDAELQRYVRYWSNLNYLGSIPFEEFDLARCVHGGAS